MQEGLKIGMKLQLILLAMFAMALVPTGILLCLSTQVADIIFKPMEPAPPKEIYRMATVMSSGVMVMTNMALYGGIVTNACSSADFISSHSYTGTNYVHTLHVIQDK